MKRLRPNKKWYKLLIRKMVLSTQVSNGARLLLVLISTYRSDKKFSVKEAAEDLGLTTKAIRNQLRQLKKADLITYTGVVPK